MAPLPGPAAAAPHHHHPPRLLLLPAAAGAAAAPPSPLHPPPPPRKRQRLAHLSAEEKALRRKLKNRVAAQSARDRKKARMGELERQAVELEAENQKLLAENQALRERTLGLAAENRELRLRLGLPATETPPPLPPAAPAAAAKVEASWDGARGEEEDEEQQLEEEEEEAASSDGEEVEVELGLGPATGSAESAAGTGPAVAPPLACLRLDPDGGPGAESDLLLGILDSLDPDMFLHYGSPEQVEEEEECAGDTGPLPTSAGFPLGPSLPKLEAINELIRFDHEYTKPFLLQVPPEGASPPGMPGAVGGEILFRAETALLRGPPVSVKEEPTDVLLPELGMSHLLSSDPQQQQQSPMDGSSDSGYEGSPSPFSDLASPLGTDYVWDEAFANELFPQLISV